MPPTLATYTSKGINYFAVTGLMGSLTGHTPGGTTNTRSRRPSSRGQSGAGCVAMTDYLRRQMFNIIAAVFLILFVAVWLAVLLRVASWVPVGGATARP